jgi:outer membrane protein OmpA-like peptidoglycan-associated protein
MARLSAGFAFAAILEMALWCQPAASQQYEDDAPIPPGAKGEVLPLKGEVLPLKAEVLALKAEVLEIRGIATGLAARVDPVQAALKELGARVTEREIKIDIAADVLFDFDKVDLRREAGPALAKVAAVLRSYPRATATIDGHTDGKGGDQYNQRLSERRADSVRRWLAANGVATHMTPRGWGKTKPIAPNTKPDGSDDPEGRQKNRRVEITVKTR